MLELKPCPFCGGTDIDAAANSVDCMTCGASATQDPDIKPSDYPDPKDAVKAWNRRSPAPTVGDDLVERLSPSRVTDAPLDAVTDILRGLGHQRVANALNEWIVENNGLKSEARTALTTLATEAERAFRDGLAYGNTVEPGDDDFDAYADEAWRTSQARARTAK